MQQGATFMLEAESQFVLCSLATVITLVVLQLDTLLPWAMFSTGTLSSLPISSVNNCLSISTAFNFN